MGAIRGEGVPTEIMHGMSAGFDEPVKAAAGATADYLLHGTPWLSSFEQGMQDQQQARAAFEQAHPYVAAGAQMLGGAVPFMLTGGASAAPELAADAGPVARAASAAGRFLMPGSEASLGARVAGNAALGGIYGFGMTDGSLQQRAQGALQNGALGGLIGSVEPLFKGAPGIVPALRNTAGGAIVGAGIGAANDPNHPLAAAEHGALIGGGIGLGGHLLANQAPAAVRGIADTIGPLVSQGARERRLGRVLNETIGDRPIEGAPTPGVNLTLDQATGSPELAANVDRWKGRNVDQATALATGNNAAVRSALNDVAGGGTPEQHSAAFTDQFKRAWEMVQAQRKRLWNAVPLTQPVIDSAPVKAAVERAMATLPPGLRSGVTGQLSGVADELAKFPDKVSVGDINSIKSSLWKIGNAFNPANAQEAGIARNLAGVVYKALDDQLTARGVDPTLRTAYARARNFEANAQEAFSTQRSRALQKTEVESTALRRFLNPSGGAIEGAGNIERVRQVLRSMRGDWERLQSEGAVDNKGVPYSHDELRATEQALKSHARGYFVQRVMQNAGLLKLDANDTAFLSPNRLAKVLSENQDWMRNSGLFSKSQLDVMDGVLRSSQMLGRTENLITQVGSATNRRGLTSKLEGTFFNDQVMKRLERFSKITSMLGGALVGYHAEGLIGAGMAGLLGEKVDLGIEQMVEKARAASRDLFDRAMSDPAFAKQLMMKARPAAGSMLSRGARAVLERFTTANDNLEAATHGLIAQDVARKLMQAGRPEEEAKATGAVVEHLYRAHAQRFGGAKGTAEELYAREAPTISRIDAATGEPLSQANRGQITLHAEGRNAIGLMSHADASTFIHETAHDWLERIARDAQDKAAPADLKSDVGALRHWLGVKDGAPIHDAAHEQFARAFERYLMEGRAPTPKLAGVFQRFKNWLTGIYQNASALNVPMTDSIRSVFGRMLTAPEGAAMRDPAVEEALRNMRPGPAEGARTLGQAPNPQTETPEFKRWFGESVVKDERGAPLMVYHGTNADFDQFRTAGRGLKLADGLGAHFGPVKAAEDRIRKSFGKNAEGANVMPVYLSIKKPLLARSGEPMSEGQLQSFLGRIADKIGIPKEKQRSYNAMRGLDPSVYRAIKQHLEAQGYDGIPYINSHEARGETSYIAFHPEQIKSAIGNRGTFDPNDPRIMFQRAAQDRKMAIRRSAFLMGTAAARNEANAQSQASRR
ncbi:MAG: hypothetical protein KGL35_21625 [Bradyrhizobium sp.]|nr:hypothetical protein [Bradyrhizobium sp.]